MKKGIKIGVITLLLLLTGCTIGGSFFMLNYSLRPEAKIRAKNADSYPFMYKNYPFLRPWVDSLNQGSCASGHFCFKSGRYPATCLLHCSSATNQKDGSHYTWLYRQCHSHVYDRLPV